MVRQSDTINRCKSEALCSVCLTALPVNNVFAIFCFLFSDPQPSCSWETISGVVNASCSIGFSGNWPPVIYWTDAQGAREANGTIIIPSLRVTSSLIIPLPGKPHEVFFVTCSVKFRIEDKPQTTTAENTPEIFLDPCKVTIEAPG